VAAALAGAVLIAFAAWLHRASRMAGATWRRAVTAITLVLAAGALALGASVGASPPATAARADKDSAGWEPFSRGRLAALRAQGQPVLVNVTAAWCLTCLVNERVAFRSPAVVDELARKGVVLLKADWTTRDPAITAMLGAFGRNGVPLYLLYPRAAGEPA